MRRKALDGTKPWNDERYPIYDIDSASLNKFRRMAKAGVMTLNHQARRAYAEAVEQAVLAKQRGFLKSHSPPNIQPACVSGTWHNTGEEIDKAIRAQQRAALSACPSRIRRSRTPAQWQAMYAEAIAEKRERQGA